MLCQKIILPNTGLQVDLEVFKATTTMFVSLSPLPVISPLKLLYHFKDKINFLKYAAWASITSMWRTGRPGMLIF